MRASGWILLLACGSAVADEEPPGVTARAPRRWTEPGPLLHLDHVLPVKSEGVGATREREGHVLELGPRARLAIERGSMVTLICDVSGVAGSSVSSASHVSKRAVKFE